MWCHLCLWCCNFSESGEGEKKVMQVDKENGRTWQTWGKLSFCIGVLWSGSQAFVLFKERAEEGLVQVWVSVGEMRLCQWITIFSASTWGISRALNLSKADIVKQKYSQVVLTMGMAVLGLCARWNRRCLVKTFSGRIKSLLELKCRLLTRQGGAGGEGRKD